jgi:hypothetical protein
MNKYMFKVYYRDKTMPDLSRWSLRASFVRLSDAKDWLHNLLNLDYAQDPDCEFKIMQYDARKKKTVTVEKYHGGYASGTEC